MRTGIRVHGLRDIQRELRVVDVALPRELRKVNLDVAEMIADASQDRGRSLGGVAAHVAPEIRARGEQRGAYVVLDARREPAILGAEFGSVRFRQFKPWRAAGYVVHPTLRDREDEVVDRYDVMLRGLLARAFPS